MLISNIITVSAETQKIELLSHRDSCYRSSHIHGKKCMMGCCAITYTTFFWSVYFSLLTQVSSPKPVPNTNFMQYYFIYLKLIIY